MVKREKRTKSTIWGCIEMFFGMAVVREEKRENFLKEKKSGRWEKRGKISKQPIKYLIHVKTNEGKLVT